MSRLTFPTLGINSNQHRAYVHHGGVSPIEKFQANLKASLERNEQGFLPSLPVNIIQIEIDPNNVLDSMVAGLMNIAASRPPDQVNLCCTDIRFHIRNDPAIDLNGVSRSLLTKAAEDINSDPARMMLFKDTESGLLYFDRNLLCASSLKRPRSESAYANEQRKEIKNCYRGLGRLIGFCLCKHAVGATLPINFPITMYKWILGHEIGLSDFSAMSPQISACLQQLPLMDEHELQGAGLSFSETVSTNGTAQSYDLIPNGADQIVTSDRLTEYITAKLQFHLCCNHIDLLGQLALGVQDLCPREVFNCLTPTLLQLVIEGEREINVDAWIANTLVKSHAGDSLGQQTIDLFWRVVRQMSQQQRQQLFCFVVGTTSLPREGFSRLDPPFTLVLSSKSVDSLPVAQTCFHVLLLPRYTDEQLLREKLLKAITETAPDHMGHM